MSPTTTDSVGHCLFDTMIGRCGVAWGPHGIVAVQLPESSDVRTRARLRLRCGAAPESPPTQVVQAAITAIAALLRGERHDLAEVRLDLRGVSDFDRSVYAITRAIPPGRTLTYGELAARLGDPGLARAVGRSLGRNPFAPVVPCHRVLAAGGRIGGFSAGEGAPLKTRMLLAEGATVGETPSLFDAAAPAAHGERGD